MNRTLILMFAKKPKFEKGIIDQPTKLKKKVSIGAKIKLKVFEFVGITDSFNKKVLNRRLTVEVTHENQQH